MDLRFSQDVLFPDAADRDKFFSTVRQSEQAFKTKYRGKLLADIAPIDSLPRTLLGGFMPIRDFMAQDRVFEDHFLFSRPAEETKASTQEIDSLAYVTIAYLGAEKKHADRYIALRFAQGVVGIGAYWGLAQDTAGNYIVVALYAHNTGQFNLDYFAQTKDAIFFVKEPNVTGFGLVDNEGRNMMDWPAIIRVDHLTDVVIVEHGSFDPTVPMAWAAPNIVSGTDLSKWDLDDLVDSARDFRAHGRLHEAFRRIEFASKKSKLNEKCEYLALDPQKDLLEKILIVKIDIMQALGSHELFQNYARWIRAIKINNASSDLGELFLKVRCLINLHTHNFQDAYNDATMLVSLHPGKGHMELLYHCRAVQNLPHKRDDWAAAEVLRKSNPAWPVKNDLRMKQLHSSQGIWFGETDKNVPPGYTLAVEPAVVWRLGGTSKRMFFEVVPARKIIYPEHRVLARNAWLQSHYVNNGSLASFMPAALRICRKDGDSDEDIFKANKGLLVGKRFALETQLFDTFMDKRYALTTKGERKAPRTSASPKLTVQEHATYGTGIFLANAHVQHSCTPNAVWSVHGRIALLHATKPIDRDEVITANMLGTELEFTSRKKAMLLQTGDKCHCNLCKQELKDDKTEKKKTKDNRIWIHGRTLREEKVNHLITDPAYHLSEENIIRIYHDAFIGPGAFQLYPRPATEIPRITWSRLYEHLVFSLTILPSDIDTPTRFLATGPGKFKSLLNVKLQLLIRSFECLLGVRGYVLDELGIRTWGEMHPVFFTLTRAHAGIEKCCEDAFYTDSLRWAWGQMREASAKCYRWGGRAPEGLFLLKDYMLEREELLSEPRSLPVTVETFYGDKTDVVMRTKQMIDVATPGFDMSWNEEYESLDAEAQAEIARALRCENGRYVRSALV